MLGDDGADGIEVGDGYRGDAFLSVQKTVKQLASQGVLVAAVSKNSPEPVAEVLRDHPRMTLREPDFVRIACIEEVAFRMGFIDRAALIALSADFTAASTSGYGRYLRELAELAEA